MSNQNQKLKSEWLRGKSSKEQEEISTVLRHNTILIKSFLEILDRMEEQEHRQEIQSSDYDSPSWAYKQADRNGAKRALSKIRSLFLFD